MHCLARDAAVAEPAPDPAPDLVEEGIFRAARVGVQAQLPDAAGERRPVGELLARGGEAAEQRALRAGRHRRGHARVHAGQQPDAMTARPAALAGLAALAVTLVLAALAALAALPAGPALAGSHPSREPSRRITIGRITIGRSVDGRPIDAWSYGPAGARRKVLVVGCIHGNECAGVAILHALRASRVPAGVQLWILPEANPDGTAADQRQNAHGVDLNRNFPYRWSRIGGPVYDAGPRPASEPETRALMAFIAHLRPAVTIWYHQHLDLVDESGGDRGVERRYAQLAGMRATCLTFLPGTATLWSNHLLRGSSAFVVELPAGALSATAVARHVRAVQAAERGQRTGSATRCDSVTPG